MQGTATRWLELGVLFLGIPLVMALLIPADRMWTVLLGTAAFGLGLLQITPGFSWKSLFQGSVNWRQFFALGAFVFIFASVLCYFVLPEQLWRIIREVPYFIPILALGYPIILVIPQELIFRPLFFKRYGGLFESETQALWANSFLFALAHLLYWNWIVLILTFLGNFIFARSYLRGSFKEAVLFHSIAGLMIFLSGLGWLFYTGGNLAQ